MDLSGKKLLFLGDNPESGVIVETANRLGALCVVVGVNKNTSPKKIAYKGIDVNALDVDALEKIANEEKIEGVAIGVADILVPAYCEICKRLNLPCYANEEAVKYLSHKSLFKAQCAKVGLPVIPEYQNSTEYLRGNLGDIPLPVVVKPVDSGGSVGITMVFDRRNLAPAIEKATKASHTATIQIEKYMTGDIVACYYTLINGKVYLSSIEDNLFTQKQPGFCPVTTGHRYASKYLSLYMKKAHDKICKLLSNVGALNGILQINAFVENDDFYFYDPGYRFQGEAQHHILKYVNGFDHKEMMINFAFTGKMYGDDNFALVNDPCLHGKSAVSVWILLNNGTIGTVKGMDEITEDPRVIFNGQRYFEGDEVTSQMLGTEKQVFSRLYVVANDKASLNEALAKIHSVLEIKDVNGKNMIVDSLS